MRPHLEFASPAWSPWLEADKEVLEKVQKRAVNMISGLKAKTYEEKLREQPWKRDAIRQTWPRYTRSSQARTW